MWFSPWLSSEMANVIEQWTCITFRFCKDILATKAFEMLQKKTSKDDYLSKQKYLIGKKV